MHSLLRDAEATPSVPPLRVATSQVPAVVLVRATLLATVRVLVARAVLGLGLIGQRRCWARRPLG